MFKLKTNVKLSGIKGDNSEESIILYFTKGSDIQTKYCISASKDIFDTIFMFNGRFDVDAIQHDKVKEFLGHGLLEESKLSFSENYNKIKQLSSYSYTAHFPLISNINIMIAIFLQKLKVRSIFYSDRIIDSQDIENNIYYNLDDIGKYSSEILENINFVSYDFKESDLKYDTDIIINSDYTDWINSDKCIVINTWNYKHTQFDNFKLFTDNAIISDNLKQLIENYKLAVQAVNDIIYSINGVYS